MTLLILDGLEPLQYPPGPMKGQLKDQGLQALLKELARSNPGLCIITTREKVENLEHVSEPALRRIFLENLSDEAGMQLLKSLGVKGTNEELKVAVDEFGGHALALNLLGSYLATVHEGEIRKRDLVPRLTDEEEQGGHAKRVMRSYEIWLKGRPELNILYLMGLFDRPAPGGAIDALRAEPVIEGLTDKLQNLSKAKWKFALKHLRELRLLAKRDVNEPDKLDCHPLVREHFGEKLRQTYPKAWKQAHGRLYEYYKCLPEKEYPDTLAETEPLFAAVAHGCLAERHEETFDDVYWIRIKRGNDHYSTNILGAFGADLAAVSCFFEKPWRQPASGLRDGDKVLVLAIAGFNLRALGRLSEVPEPMQAALDGAIDQKDWKNAAKAAGNLSELYLTLGNVKDSVYYTKQRVQFARRGRHTADELRGLGLNGNALHQAGELTNAKGLFKKAEEMQKEDEQYPYLYSLGGFLFCDLFLSQGNYKEVQKRAKQTLQWSIDGGLGPLQIALDNLSLGQAYMMEAIAEGGELTTDDGGRREGLVKEADFLDKAVEGLREAGTQHYIPRALFARSEMYRYQHDFGKAWMDLEEAKEIAERGQMNLYLPDYHLEAARLSLAEGKKIKKALEHYDKAKALVEEMGYHRRDPEVLLIQAELEILEGDKKSARETLKKAKKRIDEMGCHRWDVEVERLKELLKKATKTK